MSFTNVESTLSELVAIRSMTNNRHANELIIEYVKNKLTPYGLHTTVFDDDGYKLLVASTRDTLQPDVIFLAHADVVPGDDSLFTMQNDEDKLYGRGVWDMKFALTVYIDVVKQLGESISRHNFAIVVTTDEETRNKNTEYLIKIGYQPKCVVLPDGSNDLDIEASAKGAWTIKITATGVPAHGSRPWDGVSATARLLEALHKLQELFPSQGPDTDTLNISMLEGGQAVNQLATSASAILDIRLRSKASLIKRQSEVKSLVEELDIAWQELTLLEPLKHDLSGEYFTLFANCIRDVTSRTHKPGISFGASEASRFAAHNIPTIVTRPTGGGHHAASEWVSRQSLAHFAAILESFLSQLQDKSIQG